MIKFENSKVWGFEHAIRGMRNPLNSWERSDTLYDVDKMSLGKNDENLMVKLIKGGTPHRKFLRQIFVSVDITAPLYWWKQFDTYKVGTVSNSCSTMHKIHDKEFTPDDFSHEHLMSSSNPILLDSTRQYFLGGADDLLKVTCDMLNYYREGYLQFRQYPETAKKYWWQLIQLLPNSYNQKRTVTMDYENLINIYESRHNHKLDEWRYFCEWIDTLSYTYIFHKEVKNE